MNFRKIMLENIKNIIDSYCFKIIFIASIVINISYTLNILFNGLNDNYISLFYYVLSNRFYILIFLILVVINTLNTINIFDKNLSYVIRFKSKKEYYKNALNQIVFSNLVFIIFNLLILIVTSNVVFGSKFTISNWKNYNISNLIFIIFYVLRYIIVTEIMMIAFYLVKKVLKMPGSIIYLGIILAPLIVASNNVVSNIYDIPVYPIYYLSGYSCTSFYIELFTSIIYIFAFMLVTTAFYKILISKLKGDIESR